MVGEFYLGTDHKAVHRSRGAGAGVAAPPTGAHATVLAVGQVGWLVRSFVLSCVRFVGPLVHWWVGGYVGCRKISVLILLGDPVCVCVRCLSLAGCLPCLQCMSSGGDRVQPVNDTEADDATGFSPSFRIGYGTLDNEIRKKEIQD